MLYFAAMAAQVKRRDVGSLLLLIALELGLLCMLGVGFRCDGGDRELATGGAARIESFAFYRWAFGVEEAPPEAHPEIADASPPTEPPRPSRPARKKRADSVDPPPPEPAPVQPEPEVVAVPAASPSPPRRSLAQTLQSEPVDAAEPCGGDLCCAALAGTETMTAAYTAPRGGELDDDDNRVVVRWPPARSADVVYRVFTLPGRRFVGSFDDNWFVHARRPDDPDCYKIQACDRAGSAAGGPLTICITRHRTWG